MYSYNQITNVHIELTSKCQAKCPMCPRRINGGILNPLFNLSEITLDVFMEWFDKSFLLQLENISFCGNLGDPIIARDVLEIIEYIKSVNNIVRIVLHTNGSARNAEWWIKLASLNVYVIFGIDGLDDTHSIHRISTNFYTIIENAKLFINNGGNAEWVMLVFKHNQHQIDDCKKLSEEIGFNKFVVKHTSRFVDNKFHVLDNNGKTIDILYPTTKSLNILEKINESSVDNIIDIQCKASHKKSIYISADGLVLPCCWLDVSWRIPNSLERISFMDNVGLFPSLHDQSLKTIFESGFFDTIKNTWDNKPLYVCSKQCGKIDKCGEQFNAS